MNKICQKLSERLPEFDKWWAENKIKMNMHQSSFGLTREEQCKLAWLAAKEQYTYDMSHQQAYDDGLLDY
jgi:hypothetical protein